MTTRALVPPSTRAVVAEFLAGLFTDLPGMIELRALPSRAQHFSTLDEPHARLTFLATHWTEDLYVGVATRRDATGGTLENCAALGALFADIDFKTTPEAEAREALAVFPLPPTLVVLSGGGLHVYYGLREPLELPGNVARVRELLRRLAAYLGGDLSAAEPARVLRIPGTINGKYQPARPVILELWEPDRRYNLRELEEWLPPPPADPSGGRFQLPATPVGPGERHVLLFKLARSMKTRGLTAAAVLAAVRIENQQRCAPPLPAAEVERQVESAFSQADRPGFAPVFPQTNGAKPDEGLGLTPLGELLAEPEETHAWVVAGRLPAGGLGLLAGKPKAGKSTAARGLALAVARGHPWLGFATTPGPVIYLALEEKRAEVREHFRAMGATAGDPILVLCATAPADALARLRVEATRVRPVLIIVDPLFRFVRVDDGNDYATMTAALEPLMTLARETGAHVLLVHHLGKGAQLGADAILGSTAIFGAVDTALLMRRGEKYRTLETIQRYGEDLEELTLALDPVTRVVTAGARRQAVEQAEAARVVLEFLAGAPAPVTEAQLEASIECRTRLQRAALRALVAAGQVVRTGRGGKADPFLYSCSRSIPGNMGTRTLFPSLSREHDGWDSCSHVPCRIRVPGVPVPGTWERRAMTRRRCYLGTWTLPSGNRVDVYLGPDLALEWDTPPSPAWSVDDLKHYQNVTFPEILRAVARVTGQCVLGVQA